MEFKIDTKPTYAVITPVTNFLDAILTGSLSQKCRELIQSGSQNFIVDLSNCLDADKASLQELIHLHELCYDNSQSIVFTGVGDKLMIALKETETDLVLNIAPKMAEAIDIISMEKLERDLFNEEEEV